MVAILAAAVVAAMMVAAATASIVAAVAVPAIVPAVEVPAMMVAVVANTIIFLKKWPIQHKATPVVAAVVVTAIPVVARYVEQQFPW